MEKSLVDAYMALDKEIKKLENAKKEMEMALKESMLASGVDKAEGSDGYIKLVAVEDKVMPAKEAYLKKGYNYIRVFR